MVSEKLNIQFDIENLVSEFKNQILKHDPFLARPGYGGWSLTCSTGNYQEGFTKERIDATGVKPEDLQKWMKESGVINPLQHRKKTALCQGIFNEVVEKLEEIGLIPCRVRIALMGPGSIPWHQDCPAEIYNVRAHIPLITNPECYFEFEGEKEHLPADGSVYLVKVNRRHRASNFGNQIRYHLMCDVFDTKAITQHHQFPEKLLPKLEEQRRLFQTTL